MSDQETLAVYAVRAEEYAGLVDSGHVDARLRAFLDGLPDNAHVLDLGCGPGRSAALMAKAGHRVIATDAVPEMVAMARNHPGVTARQATFDALDDIDTYDGIWANFSLLHAKRADLPRHVAAIARALRPGGLFHIGMKTGQNALRDRLGRYYTYVTQDELTGLLSDAGLVPAGHWTGEDRGLDGSLAPWIVMQARKHA